MATVTPTTGFVSAVGRWLDANILALGREMRLSYLPPLMVYAAAGISGLTSIVGTFYVKERLGLSAEFLAALGFWMMLPWALKMPLGAEVLVLQADVAITSELEGLDQILSMQVGDVIPLNIPEFVTASVDGVPVMECRYGISNGHYALRMEKILASGMHE